MVHTYCHTNDVFVAGKDGTGTMLSSQSATANLTARHTMRNSFRVVWSLVVPKAVCHNLGVLTSDRFQINTTYTSIRTLEVQLDESEGRQYACVARGVALGNQSGINSTVTIIPAGNFRPSFLVPSQSDRGGSTGNWIESRYFEHIICLRM